jgi:hypothetical protein
MWPPVNRLALLICSLCLMSSLPAAADDVQEQRDAERGRFLVSVGITSGVLIAQQNGQITTSASNLSLPPNVCLYASFTVGVLCATPAPLGPDVKGSVNTVSPNVGVNLELMTPALEFIPTKPRFFAAVEFLPTFAPSQTVALNGAATTFLVPDQANNTFSAAAIGGQGSRLTATVMTSVVTADAGIAFEFEFKKRLMRFKPFAGWLRWGVVSEGKILTAFKNDPVPPNSFLPLFGDNIRFVTLNGNGSGFFNAVGPGFELEMEVAKHGPVRPVLYLMGAGYRTVGTNWFEYQSGTTVTDQFYDALPYTSTPTGPCPPPAGCPAVQYPAASADYATKWTFQVDDWSYRAGIGLRLRWVGFD